MTKTGKLTCYFWVRDQFLPETDCSPAKASVLLALAGYGNPDGTSIRPGVPLLIRVTKYSESEIKRAIKFWKSHASSVLREVSPSVGRGNASVFRIHMFDVESKGVTDKPLSSNKGVHDEPFSDSEGVHDEPFLTDKRVPTDGEMGSKRGSPRTPTELPKKNTEEEEERSLALASASSAFAALGHKPFGKETFQLAWMDHWSKAGTHPDWIDVMEQTVEQVGSQNIPRMFFNLKRQVEDGKLKVKPCIPVTPPADTAKAKLLWTTAQASGWLETEFRSYFEHEFYFRIHFTIEDLAKLSESDYQTALTRFQSPPDSICPECGNRCKGRENLCEHQQTGWKRLFESFHQRMK